MKHPVGKPIHPKSTASAVGRKKSNENEGKAALLLFLLLVEKSNENEGKVKMLYADHNTPPGCLPQDCGEGPTCADCGTEISEEENLKLGGLCYTCAV